MPDVTLVCYLPTIPLGEALGIAVTEAQERVSHPANVFHSLASVSSASILWAKEVTQSQQSGEVCFPSWMGEEWVFAE